MHHSFDVEIAQEHGVPIAIFLNNVEFWIKKNIANRKHFHNGRYWTYNSSEALKELFPYWSTDQLDRIIKKCAELDLLMLDNFNKSKFDRTRWYGFTDKALKLFKITIPQDRGNQTETPRDTNREIAEPIPDINTDIKTDKSKSPPLNDKKINNPYKRPYPQEASRQETPLADVTKQSTSYGYRGESPEESQRRFEENMKYLRATG